MIKNSGVNSIDKIVPTKRLSDELKEAANVQEVLLKHDAPKCVLLECKGQSIPAHYLGGDYYGYVYEEDKQRYWVFIGDVMGKGIPAFAKMAMLRTAIRILAPQSESPSELLESVNANIYEDMKLLRSFATLFCGMYNLKENTFTYASAGHPSAILKRENQPCEFLDAKGIAIGFLPNRTYEEHKLGMNPNDYICIFTDGVFETMNGQKEQFGRERIVEIVNNHAHYPSLIPTITEHVLTYSNYDQRDDVTMVTIKRIPH